MEYPADNRVSEAMIAKSLPANATVVLPVDKWVAIETFNSI